MALKKKPVTGMKDMMPGEMEIRDYVIGLIKETYKSFGFPAEKAQFPFLPRRPGPSTVPAHSCREGHGEEAGFRR